MTSCFNKILQRSRSREFLIDWVPGESPNRLEKFVVIGVNTASAHSNLALKVWSCVGGLICECSTKAKTCQRNSILNVNEFHPMAVARVLVVVVLPWPRHHPIYCDVTQTAVKYVARAKSPSYVNILILCQKL